MRITRADQDDVAVLRLEGEFDSFEAAIVQESFEECLAAGRPRVVLDLGELAFVNSSTLAYLISAQKKARELGGGVVLARPREFIKKTIQTLGLHQIFPMADTLDDAVGSLRR